MITQIRHYEPSEMLTPADRCEDCGDPMPPAYTRLMARSCERLLCSNCYPTRHGLHSWQSDLDIRPMPNLNREPHTVPGLGEVEVWVGYDPHCGVFYSATGDPNEPSEWVKELDGLADARPAECSRCAFPILTSRSHCQDCEELEAGLQAVTARSSFFINAPDLLAEIAWSLWTAAGGHEQKRTPAEFARAYEWALDRIGSQPAAALQLIDETAAWMMIDGEKTNVAHAA